MAHTRQSRPDHGLGFQVKVLWPRLSGEGLSSLGSPPRVDDLGPASARLGDVGQRGLEARGLLDANVAHIRQSI